jgi:MFS family permease
VIAGACTFLNVYCTQPLLPLFQHLFGATEVEVSFTVGAVTLSVALVAPFVGMLAESIGRKRVIVPALFAMAVPMFLAATATSLRALIWWRLAQGLFVPGVIAVIIAYINEEFTERRGFVMAAYVAGGVFGGFIGRFLTGIITEQWNWRAAFVLLGILDLLGAFAVRRWLPLAKSFVPGKHVFHSLCEALEHLGNWRLLAVCGMGFTVLFSLVGVFTYVNFHLARAPYSLSPAQLGEVFAVYLLGCVVTPLAGEFLDRHGFRKTSLLALAMNLAGLLATLAHSLPLIIVGLALFSSGIFISQSAATVQTGHVAERARSAAAGIYVTCYYIGGTAGSAAPAWFWHLGGWPACVGLFAAVSIITVFFAFGGERRAA